MKVYKFGGASVKDAKSVKNITKILKSISSQSLLLVISAMGKMTNAFEKLIKDYQLKDTDYHTTFDLIKKYHVSIIDELFDPDHVVYQQTEELFEELQYFLHHNKNFDYNYIYDQVVIYGELLSTKIISNYLQTQEINTLWVDARKIITTDTNYRDANVDWGKTCENCHHFFQADSLYITQGFIAGSTDNSFTTLGREGSDYSAAILAYCLHAESITIWKDVPGVYNADPRFFKQKIVLEQISYREALEMAFYGASIIHPKTIKPLENKHIPLFVKHFVKPDSKGTIIKEGIDLIPKTACYTYKKNQILLSISSKDFSFIIEKNIGEIFNLLASYKMKVNLIQNSAISFSVCIEDPFNLFDIMLKEIKKHFQVIYNKEVKLISIRHFSTNDIEKTQNIHTVLVTQQTTKTVQFVVK